jgi:DNA-binding response OmpR family regulator
MLRIILILMAQILAIHEEEDSLALIRRVLSGHGHHVVSFARPRDAARWLEDHMPDLVVVSGGRHGEKAKRLVGILKDAGLSGSIILLLTLADTRSSIVDGMEEQVRITETSDYEELLKAVNSAVKEKGAALEEANSRRPPGN